jgi:hypothetical protein
MKTTKLFGAIFMIAIMSCCGPEPDDPCKGVNCGEHGTCLNGTCNCDMGYSGTACETLNCPADKCPTYQECREIDGACVGDDPCDPSPCNGHGTCTCIGVGQAECTCAAGYDGNTCHTCAEGYTGYPTCVVDLCYGVTCNGHGSCNSGTGLCDCNDHYDPASYCTTCLGNWDVATDCTTCLSGYGGPNCDPEPTISDLEIDCSDTFDMCLSDGNSYPVTFSVTDATSCTANAVVTSGSGTPGSTSDCIINENSGSLTYTSGSDGGDIIRITVEISSAGGTDSDYIDITLQ